MFGALKKSRAKVVPKVLLGRGVVRRLTDDPQLSRLTEQPIRRAAIETERHLMNGKRVNGKFVRKLTHRL